MSTLDLEYWKQAFVELSAAFEAEKLDLCRLDGTIGDGDHGTSMALGFKEAANRLSGDDSSGVGGLLKTVGLAFISSVGGVTGIIFGTLFVDAGKEVTEKADIDTKDLAEMFAAGLAGVKLRGKAKEGDKSMVDALAPAAKALVQASGQGLGPREALDLACRSAEQGMEATRRMHPKVGRARYQKGRAIGHIDAGAASVALMFRTLAQTARE